eukprot:c27662_g1_i1 orf=3-296(-)
MVEANQQKPKLAPLQSRVRAKRNKGYLTQLGAGGPKFHIYEEGLWQRLAPRQGDLCRKKLLSPESPLAQWLRNHRSTEDIELKHECQSPVIAKKVHNH